nr:hypothetical protein ACMD2_12233 [Ipomoea batatas]
MSLVVRNVRQQRLINIEHPSILPVAGDTHSPRESQRSVRHGIGIGAEPVAGHVILYEYLTSLRDQSPAGSVIGLDGELPALAIQIIISRNFPVTDYPIDGEEVAEFRREGENGLGSRCGKQWEEERTVMAKFLPEFLGEKLASIHAKINGGRNRHKQSRIRHARHVFHPNLNPWAPILPFTFNARTHHKSPNRRLFPRSGVIYAENPAFLHVHGALCNGGPVVQARVRNQLEFVAEPVHGPSLAPRFKPPPWLPAAHGAAVRPEDEPRAGVGSGNAVSPENVLIHPLFFKVKSDGRDLISSNIKNSKMSNNNFSSKNRLPDIPLDLENHGAALRLTLELKNEPGVRFGPDDQMQHRFAAELGPPVLEHDGPRLRPAQINAHATGFPERRLRVGGSRWNAAAEAQESGGDESFAAAEQSGRMAIWEGKFLSFSLA